MKKIMLLICISFFSCNNQNKIERADEPTIYGISNDDSEMNRAILKAQQTISEFETAFKSNNPDFNAFTIKKRFDEGENVEHIWITDIEIVNDKYFGKIGNLPEVITHIKLGEKTEIKKQEISDWMYLDKSKLRGGYTIRVIRDRMSDAEKKEFDIANGMIIE